MNVFPGNVGGSWSAVTSNHDSQRNAKRQNESRTPRWLWRNDFLLLDSGFLLRGNWFLDGLLCNGTFLGGLRLCSGFCFCLLLRRCRRVQETGRAQECTRQHTLRYKEESRGHARYCWRDCTRHDAPCEESEHCWFLLKSQIRYPQEESSKIKTTVGKRGERKD